MNLLEDNENMNLIEVLYLNSKSYSAWILHSKKKVHKSILNSLKEITEICLECYNSLNIDLEEMSSINQKKAKEKSNTELIVNYRDEEYYSI